MSVPGRHTSANRGAKRRAGGEQWVTPSLVFAQECSGSIPSRNIATPSSYTPSHTI